MTDPNVRLARIEDQQEAMQAAIDAGFARLLTAVQSIAGAPPFPTDHDQDEPAIEDSDRDRQE